MPSTPPLATQRPGPRGVAIVAVQPGAGSVRVARRASHLGLVLACALGACQQGEEDGGAGAASGVVVAGAAPGAAIVAGSAAPAAGGAESPNPTSVGSGGAASPESGGAGSPASAAGSGAAQPSQASAGDGAGDEASAAPPEQTAAEPDPVTDLGVGDGSDVITIGDSWMNYLLTGGGIEGALSRAGKSYRNYGVAGTLLLNGQIPGQYATAKLADPDIATVIMTGGGNDIMFSGGCNTEDACRQSIQALVDGLDQLWTQMADDGVEDVVYVRYAEGAGTTNSNNIPDEPAPIPPICLAGRIRCHSLDTTDLVMGELLDGIHPTPAANDRIAAGLLELLQAEGIRR